MTLTDVISRVSRAGVDVADVDFYLDLLCDVSFLAIQTTNGFRFASDEGDRQMLRGVARTLAKDRNWGEESYEINPAFYQVLQIEE